MGIESPIYRTVHDVKRWGIEGLVSSLGLGSLIFCSFQISGSVWMDWTRDIGIVGQVGARSPVLFIFRVVVVSMFLSSAKRHMLISPFLVHMPFCFHQVVARIPRSGSFGLVVISEPSCSCPIRLSSHWRWDGSVR